MQVAFDFSSIQVCSAGWLVYLFFPTMMAFFQPTSINSGTYIRAFKVFHSRLRTWLAAFIHSNETGVPLHFKIQYIGMSDCSLTLRNQYEWNFKKFRTVQFTNWKLKAMKVSWKPLTMSCRRTIYGMCPVQFDHGLFDFGTNIHAVEFPLSISVDSRPTFIFGRVPFVFGRRTQKARVASGCNSR